MFTLQDAIPASLSAVDDSLLINAPELTKDQVTAASETHLYVQTVAKGIAQQRGLDIGSPDLYKSDDWYKAMVDAVASYADWVEIVGDKSVTVNNSTHSGSINLSAIMGAVMTLYLGATAAAEWSTLSTLLGGAEDPGVSDFMNFWWSRVQKSSTDTGLAVGPNIETSDGQVQWAVCYYSMTHVIDDWRTLFVSSTYESFDVSAAGLTLQMDVDLYNSLARTSVLNYLKDDIANKIRNAPIPKPTLAFSLGATQAPSDLGARILSAPRPSPVGGGSTGGSGSGSSGSGGTSATGPEAGGGAGAGGGQVVTTRDIHDVTVLPLHGDAMLGGAGLGHIDFVGTDVSQLRCGIFATTKPMPTVDEQYRITGTFDDTNAPFSYTLKCTQAGRPVSYFGPA